MVRATAPRRSPSSRCHPRYVHDAIALTVGALTAAIDGVQGIDADQAYQMVHDELSLDGSPLLNLASFVHVWMPDPAMKLVQESK